MAAEVTNISVNGIWMLIKDVEYFLPFNKFPWFQDASVAAIQAVKLVHGHFLRWDLLDVDLELESLEHLERYPLIYR